MPIQAIIYVPAQCADAARWLNHCYVYCAVRGYVPLHVARRWADVITILAAGCRAVVVASRIDHIEGLEIVSDQRPGDDPPASRRPTRM
jgi:hypothetical protein